MARRTAKATPADLIWYVPVTIALPITLVDRSNHDKPAKLYHSAVYRDQLAAIERTLSRVSKLLNQPIRPYVGEAFIGDCNGAEATKPEIKRHIDS